MIIFYFIVWGLVHMYYDKIHHENIKELRFKTKKQINERRLRIQKDVEESKLKIYEMAGIRLPNYRSV